MISETFVFSCPGQAYKDMNEDQVAAAYGEMLLNYDQDFVFYSDDYNCFRDVADARKLAGLKNDRPLIMSAFVAQDVKRFGRISGDFLAYRYLINPLNMQMPEIRLPDLEVLYIFGKNPDEAALEILDFYKKYGWIAKKVSEKANMIKARRSPYSRLTSREIKIFDPQEVRKIATRELGYDSERLYWRTEA